MRKTLITGLIILCPIVLTILLFVYLVDLFTNPFLKLLTPLLTSWNLVDSEFIVFFIRILVLVFLFFIIVLLGFLARWFLFDALIVYFNKLINRIPIIKKIYQITTEVINGFIRIDNRKAFTHPVMAEFPIESSYVVSFVSGEVPTEWKEKTQKNLVGVFVPTSPHPFTGYFLLFDKSHIHTVAMSNEEAVKFAISCGIVVPEKK